MGRLRVVKQMGKSLDRSRGGLEGNAGRSAYMRNAALCLLLALGPSTRAMAGQVYGTIFHSNQPLPGVAVILRCPGEESDGRTDNAGVYRVFVKATGSCTLVLEPNGRNAAGSVYSYDRPTSYDFDLVDQGGHWVLVAHKR
jgi:hypothetical protein